MWARRGVMDDIDQYLVCMPLPNLTLKSCKEKKITRVMVAY